jgi:hypothetical protein
MQNSSNPSKNKFINKEIYYLKSSDSELIKPKVVDDQNNSFDIPFYVSPEVEKIELSKKIKKDGTVDFSLLFHEEFGYKLNEVYEFTVLSTEKRKKDQVEKFTAKVKNDSNEEFSFPIKKAAFLNIKPNDKIKCLVEKIYPKKIFFSLVFSKINHTFIDDFEYTFEIIDKGILHNRKDLASFIVRHGNHYFDLIGPAWQFSYDTIRSIKGTVNKENKIVQSFNNLSHPLFEKGKVYTFYFLETLQNNPDYILVKGVDDCIYSIRKPFIFEQKDFETGIPIKLVYREISESSGAIKVKYFIQFEEIIQDFRAIKRITFDTFRREINEEGISELDIVINKLYKDYVSSSNKCNWMLLPSGRSEAKA